MNTPKNIRIILTPANRSNRKDLENIENTSFSSVSTLARKLAIMNGESTAKIFTIDEFKVQTAFSSASKSFLLAVSNQRKRKQCYKLTDFMDDFNNQEFGRETDNYWMGYVKIKKP